MYPIAGANIADIVNEVNIAIVVVIVNTANTVNIVRKINIVNDINMTVHLVLNQIQIPIQDQSQTAEKVYPIDLDHQDHLQGHLLDLQDHLVRLVLLPVLLLGHQAHQVHLDHLNHQVHQSQLMYIRSSQRWGLIPIWFTVAL